MKFIILLFVLTNAFAQTSDLRTIAEKSGWKSTGRAIETELLCKAFQKKFPKDVACKSYGKTPEGRNLLYIMVGDRNPKNPVVWAQAGIHAGEIDGKDAVFWLMKDILEKKITSNPLQGVTLIFIPIVNVDGHERFGKWNRPNQVGPEEMGWRTTAHNLNMNRDFMKADSPEMQAMLKLWLKVDPIVSLDLHVTNGAQFEPEVGIIIIPNEFHGSTSLHKAGRLLENGLMEKLKARGHKALPFYPSFEEEDKPSTGFGRYVSNPRYSQGYWYAQNRIGMLVESHSWKDYATRVKVHYSTVLSTLEMVGQHGKDWVKAAEETRNNVLAGKEVNLSYKHNDKSRLIDFPGYKYKIQKSDITGEDVIKYFPDQPENWKVPFYEVLYADSKVMAPKEGYIIPGTHAKWVKEKLDIHGIRYQSWKPSGNDRLEVFRSTTKEFAKTSFEGHQQLVVTGSWANEEVKIAPGAIFVPIEQKRAFLIMQFFEPVAKDSFVSWGFFNPAFEPKEYMEKYVLEDVAKEMLKDKNVAAEFKQRLKDDAFSKDPAQRHDFFYRKHASWDVKYNMYPVFRK
ncbi:MAG TPA: M14 family zinc carboxypeptidase [Bacteriovoracaceae bacterium]|nr:M14 family zinc carboxypeptidase [Bacteriovoracaceae bacterium]